MQRVFFLLTLIAALACEAQRATPAPPADSYTTKAAQVKIGGAVLMVNAAVVTPEFFRAVNVQPLLGRLFLDDDFHNIHLKLVQAVGILSNTFWTDRFAASPSVIGQKIDIDGHPTVIVGILPKTFTTPGETQLWMPR